MKKILNKLGFTFVELLVSLTIFSIIILGLSVTLIQISDRFYFAQKQVEIFSEIKIFLYDSINFQYNSGMIISGTNKYDTLLLYGEKGGIVIGLFEENNLNTNFSLVTDSSLYQASYLGYFNIQKNELSGILSDTGSIYQTKFNAGKVFRPIYVNNLSLNTYNTGSIFGMKLDILLDTKKQLFGEKKQNLDIPHRYIFPLKLYF